MQAQVLKQMIGQYALATGQGRMEVIQYLALAHGVDKRTIMHWQAGSRMMREGILLRLAAYMGYETVKVYAAGKFGSIAAEFEVGVAHQQGHP